MIRLRKPVAACILICMLQGCSKEDAITDEDRDACFDRYMAEFKGQYPDSTLEKTAALKCYSN
ncbi:MAG TPA: hypothetical protein DIT38_07950 [Burkholderiales bacterium]|jgi:hypothetical protein|nr:hypothetical protein [Burkholderiales bacterium]